MTSGKRKLECLAKVLDVSLSAEVLSNYLLEKPMQYVPSLLTCVTLRRQKVPYITSTVF